MHESREQANALVKKLTAYGWITLNQCSEEFIDLIRRELEKAWLRGFDDYKSRMIDLKREMDQP